MARCTPFILCCAVGLALSCATPECEALWDGEEYDAAHTTCAAEYRDSKRCEAGLGAAKAAYKLKRYDEVFVWAERLDGSDCAADALYWAGGAHKRLGQPEQGSEAFHAANTLFMEAWEHTGACDAAVGAAKSAYAGARYAEVLEWPTRVAGRACEADAADWVGRSLSKLGRKDEAAASYERGAELYVRQGRHDKAFKLYGWAFRAVRAEDHRRLLDIAVAFYRAATHAQDDRQTAASLTYIFEVLHDVGDERGARWASDEWHRLAELESEQSAFQSAIQRGVVYQMEGDLDSAGGRYARAAELADALELDHAIRAANLNLVEIELAGGRLAAAEAALEAAERAAGPDRPPYSLPYYRARLQLERGEIDAAARGLKAMMDRYAAAGREIAAEWLWRYEHLLGVAAERSGNPAAAALAYARSIDVVETMHRSIAVPGIVESLLADKREPYERLFVLEANRGRPREALAVVERSKGRAFLDALMESAEADRHREHTVLDRAVRRVDGLSRVLAAAKAYEPSDPLSVDELLDRLGDLRAVSYFRALDRYWAVAVSRGAVEVVPLEGNVEEIRALVRRFEVSPGDAALANRLSDVLIRRSPILDWTGRVHIVTDRDTRHVPFAALRRDGRYLVEDATISFVPSLNVLLRIAETPPPAAAAAPVVLGNPEGKLPHSAQEAKDVAALLSVEPSLGAKADADALRRARGASVLHVAAHGGMSPGGAWLALADGHIGTDRILNDRLGATTVVLASCESAVNDGAGLWGALATAFLATGSRNVVATRWPVNDDTTRRLILRFYALGGAGDPPRALALAQRELVARDAPVADWVAFLVLGANREGER